MTQKRLIGIGRWLLLGVGIFFLVQYFWPDPPEIEALKISQVLQLAQDNQVSKIEVRGDHLTVVNTEGQRFSSRKETGVSILQLLEQRGVAPGSIEIEVHDQGISFMGIFLSLLPMLLFGVLIIYMIRKSRGAMNQMMNIGKSQARNVAESKPDSGCRLNISRTPAAAPKMPLARRRERYSFTRNRQPAWANCRPIRSSETCDSGSKLVKGILRLC